MFHHTSSVDNTDVLELVDPESDLDLLGRPQGRTSTFDYSTAAPLTRTIINDIYQVEKSSSTTTGIYDSNVVEKIIADDDGNLNNSSILIVDNVFDNLHTTTTLESSTEVVGDETFRSTTTDVSSTDDVQNDKQQQRRLDEEPMDTTIFFEKAFAAAPNNLESDPKIACKKELNDVERRINELADGPNVKPKRDESRENSADSSTDSVSTSGTEDGEKSDSSRADKQDSGSDSKKRKISPMAVEEEQKEKRSQHSKHKKVKSAHTERTRTKLVKDKKDMKTFFEDARYFLIKSANSENVILSKAKGVWSTTPRNEQTLNKAFRETRNVILIFSVEKSQAFQGFCRLASESLRDTSPVNWVLPPGMNARNLGGVFKLLWINRNEVPFVNTSQLFNPWNEYKPVKIGRDGTELAPNVGRELCGMFNVDDGVDLSGVIKKVKKMQDDVASKTNGGGRRRGGRYSEMRRQWGSPPETPAPASRYVKQPDARSTWRDAGSSAPAAHQHPSYSSGAPTGGRYRDVFMNGSYYDYIREYSTMSGTYPDPYANAMYGTAQTYYQDPYYGYGGYPSQQQPQQLIPSSYGRRASGRESPPPASHDKYYNRESNYDYYRRDLPPRFADRRRRHSQSPDPPPMPEPAPRNRTPPGARRSTHPHRGGHRSKSPRRPASPVYRSGASYRRSGKY